MTPEAKERAAIARTLKRWMRGYAPVPLDEYGEEVVRTVLALLEERGRKEKEKAGRLK